MTETQSNRFRDKDKFNLAADRNEAPEFEHISGLSKLAGETYIVSVPKKTRRFTPPTMTIPEASENVNFRAQP